ncbi:MAG: thiamine phosphate synthase [Halomonadaceae bacterium]|nr:MAG: thiamine phosphate synthase [Halomonadaceae bacterium]
MNPLPRRGLYAITDPFLLPGERLLSGVAAALKGGAVMVQYRDKHCSGREARQRGAQLLELCREYGVPLIINDNPDLAHELGADGVHLGRSDPDLAGSRQRLGSNAIIGASCQGDVEHAALVAGNPADYVAFGRFFTSNTKSGAGRAPLHVLEQARSLGVPRVAIGGITLDNAPPVIAAGADLLAVVQGLFGAEDIEARARAFSQLFEPFVNE